jgi:hypothetical protein
MTCYKHANQHRRKTRQHQHHTVAQLLCLFAAAGVAHAQTRTVCDLLLQCWEEILAVPIQRLNIFTAKHIVRLVGEIGGTPCVQEG